MNIRRGTIEDLPRALELIVELAVFEREPNAVETTVESMAQNGFGENPIFGFFVAEDQSGHVVGLSLYYWRYSTWKGKRLHLEDLIVTESARGQGIGTALFEKTMAFGVEQGCTGMTWQVLDWNEPAINFYKSYQAQLDGEWVNCCLSREQIQQIVN